MYGVKVRKKSFTFSIRGHKWKFVLLPDSDYVKKHGATTGMTIPDLKVVDFKLSEFTKWHVAHELTHVYTSYMHLDSSNITASDMEEIMASFIASDIDEFITMRDKIYTKMNTYLTGVSNGRIKKDSEAKGNHSISSQESEEASN